MIIFAKISAKMGNYVYFRLRLIDRFFSSLMHKFEILPKHNAKLTLDFINNLRVVRNLRFTCKDVTDLFTSVKMLEFHHVEFYMCNIKPNIEFEYDELVLDHVRFRYMEIRRWFGNILRVKKLIVKNIKFEECSVSQFFGHYLIANNILMSKIRFKFSSGNVMNTIIKVHDKAELSRLHALGLIFDGESKVLARLCTNVMLCGPRRDIFSVKDSARVSFRQIHLFGKMP